MKTFALLIDGISSVEICQWGVRVEVRALCVAQGAAQPLQKELGPSGTGTRRTVRDKFDTLAGLLPFLACIAPSIASKKRQSTPQSVISGGPSLMVPNPFAVAAPPLGVHIMPSLQPELPIGRSQHLKCHQLAAQRFSLYLLVHPVGRVKTFALLIDGISSVEICHWGVRVEARALCVPQGAAQSLQKAPKKWHRKTLGEYPALTPRYCFCLLPTTGEGWPKAMRHENACLLCGPNLGYHSQCPPKILL